MNTTLKGLVLASLANLLSSSLGTVIAWQHNLTANFGGFLNGQDVPRDFLTLKGQRCPPRGCFCCFNWA
jgi:hypothetical protein